MYNFDRKKIIAVVVFVLIIIVIIVSSVFSLSHKPKNYVLTQKTTESTLHVKAKDSIKIESKTFSDLEITTEIENPSIIQPSSSTKFQNGNYSGNFKARSVGETDIVVYGKPKCKKGEVCIPLIVNVYKVHVVVDK